MNIILLGARYFCIPVNILEFCSGIHLSYLEMWISISLLTSGGTQMKAGGCMGMIYKPQEGENQLRQKSLSNVML